jgi:hypothetical protein
MSNSRKADAAASASPWRFIFQIKGVQGLPQGINQVAVFWKTRFAQARVRLAVGSASSGLRFEKGCLSVDTTFLEDPLLSDGQPVRDKMLIFSVKGYRGGEEDEGGLRIGSFSFRCLQAMAQTPVGRTSRTFKAAVDSSGLSHGCSVVVSLRVTYFPVWMSPAFSSELGGCWVQGEGVEARLQQTMSALANLSQDYIASRTFLSRGCSSGSIALLDPIFRSPLSLAAQEPLFPAPPFPRHTVDSSFSAIMAPAVLQEAIAVNICRLHSLNNELHSNIIREKLAVARDFICRRALEADCTFVFMVFTAWSKHCEQSRRKKRMRLSFHFLTCLRQRCGCPAPLPRFFL